MKTKEFGPRGGVPWGPLGSANGLSGKTKPFVLLFKLAQLVKIEFNLI